MVIQKPARLAERLIMIDFTQFDMDRHEPLRPELRGWVQGSFLKHPICTEILIDPNRCGYLHALYDSKVQLLEQAEKDREWDKVLWLHEKWYRFNALYEYAKKMPDKSFWKAFGDTWVSIENIRYHLPLIRHMLRKNRPGREYIMTAAERRAFARLPDTLQVYRGYSQRRAKQGWSWTLKLKTAKFFARRFAMLNDGVATVVAGTVQKGNVIAYFTRMQEAEIVTDPVNVSITSTLRPRA